MPPWTSTFELGAFIWSLLLFFQPTIFWFSCAALYQQLGEKGNEMENSEYYNKKADDLQKRLASAHASIHHLELVSPLLASLNL